MVKVCFKYNQNGVVKTVISDHKPFTEAESYFADAKYFMQKTKIGSTEEDEWRKESEPIWKEKPSPPQMEGLIMPLTKIDYSKPQPLKGFVRPKQSKPTEHGDIQDPKQSKTIAHGDIQGPKQSKTTKHGDIQGNAIPMNYGQSAYNLLVKARYNPHESSTSEPHLKMVNQMVRSSRTGVGSMTGNHVCVTRLRSGAENIICTAKLGPVTRNPIRIAVRRAIVNYVAGEETDESPNKREVQRTSVFKRIGKWKLNECPFSQDWVKGRM